MIIFLPLVGIVLAILAIVELINVQKAKGQSFAATDPSFQLCPDRTAQLVSLNMREGLVMKRTIRRT